MNIKKGDNVQIMAGANRGKRGKIIAIHESKNKVTVEGLNLVKKHRKPKNQGEKGELISVPRPISASNALLVCSSCDKGVRTGYKLENEAKVRYCKKCKNPI